MTDRLSDEDVERVSNRVASKLIRYAVIGLVVWFVIIPLLAMLLFGVWSISGAGVPFRP